MTKKDWEILPPPLPWKSISNFEWNRRWGFTFFLWMPGIIMFPSGIWVGLMSGNFFSAKMWIYWLISLGSLIIGLVMQYRLYRQSTDGTDNWMIIPPRSTDLCVAMETAFDEMLKTGGVRYTPGELKTKNINYVTNRRYGRNYIIYLGPNGSSLRQGLQKESDIQTFVLDFAYRPGSRVSSPYLTIELRGITEANYGHILAFQKRVVDTLERLKYQSYHDHLWL
jgi:hypothetical protein